MAPPLKKNRGITLLIFSQKKRSGRLSHLKKKQHEKLWEKVAFQKFFQKITHLNKQYKRIFCNEFREKQSINKYVCTVYQYSFFIKNQQRWTKKAKMCLTKSRKTESEKSGFKKQKYFRAFSCFTKTCTVRVPSVLFQSN